MSNFVLKLKPKESFGSVFMSASPVGLDILETSGTSSLLVLVWFVAKQVNSWCRKRLAPLWLLVQSDGRHGEGPASKGPASKSPCVHIQTRVLKVDKSVRCDLAVERAGLGVGFPVPPRRRFRL